jgi:hypothetical protein
MTLRLLSCQLLCPQPAPLAAAVLPRAPRPAAAKPEALLEGLLKHSGSPVPRKQATPLQTVCQAYHQFACFKEQLTHKSACACAGAGA